MKKLGILLLALAIATVAFADGHPTVTGSASLTWGFDLDTETHGFTNSTSATVTFPVFKAGDAAAEEAISGSITVSEFTGEIKGGEYAQSGGAVTAKLLLPNDLYLQIASAPSFKVDKATAFGPFAADKYTRGIAPTITSAGGFTFGMTGDVNFAVKVGSTNTHTYAPDAATDDEVELVWMLTEDIEDEVAVETLGVYSLVEVTTKGDDAGAAAANQYLAGVDFGMALGDMGSLSLAFIYGALGADTPTMALGLGASLALIDGLDVDLGFDVNMTDTDAIPMDIMAKVAYTMEDLVKVTTGVFTTLSTADAVDMRLDAMLSVGVLAVEDMTFNVGAHMWDVLEEARQIAFDVKADYTVALEGDNYMKPYCGLGYSLANEEMLLNLGVATMMFPHTVFTLDYAVGKWAKNALTIDGGMLDAEMKGIVTFKTTISL